MAVSFCACARDGNLKMRKFILGFGAFLLTCVMLGAMAYAVPATWVANHVGRASGGRLQIAQARGFWHQGSGFLVVSSAPGGSDAMHWQQALEWQLGALQWPWLWSLHIKLPEVGPPLSVLLSLNRSGWAMATTPWRGVLPLAVLQGLGAPFNTLALEGDAQFGLAAVPLVSAPPRQAPISPNIEIHIKQLRSALAREVVLGDYVVQGTASGSGGAFVLRTTSGVLQLDGAGDCRGRPRLTCSFKGTARAKRQDDAVMANLLGLLGEQQGRKRQANDTEYVTELRW